MHSIVMPSLPAFFYDFLLDRQSDSMLPFSPFDPAAITAEVDAIPGCNHNFRSSIPFSLLQYDDVTTLSGTYSQEAVDVANAVDTFESCCAHIKSDEREFFQPPSRSGGLVLHAGGLPHRPLLSSLFLSECLPPFAQFQVFT